MRTNNLTNATTTQINKMYAGCYRTEARSWNGEQFAQIKKQGREWLIEVREVETGDLVNYAGLWNTLTDAKEEAVSVLRPEWERKYYEEA
jgi:hypothetical protein